MACVRVGCTCMGERRDHAAQGRAEHVGPVLGKWHRAGSACIARVRRAAQVRLVRGLGSFAAYQQVKRAGSFGNRGTRGGHTTVGRRAKLRARVALGEGVRWPPCAPAWLGAASSAAGWSS
eukprot:scaffold144299_cov148-Phaeocystis_antarctica.AAC.1